MKLKAPEGTADIIRGPVTGAEMKVISSLVEVESEEDAKVLMENLGFTKAE